MGRPKNVEEICISIAWDWVWLGYNETDVQKEIDCVQQAVESHRLCKGATVPISLCLHRFANSGNHKTLPNGNPIIPAILPALKELYQQEAEIETKGLQKYMLDSDFFASGQEKAPGGEVFTCDGCEMQIFNYFWTSVGGKKTTAMRAWTKNMLSIAMRTAAEAAVFLFRILQSHSSTALDTFTKREKTWQHMQTCLKHLTHQPEAFEYMSMPNITLAQIALIFNKKCCCSVRSAVKHLMLFHCTVSHSVCGGPFLLR